jgi:hypothetical protein
MIIQWFTKGVFNFEESAEIFLKLFEILFLSPISIPPINVVAGNKVHSETRILKSVKIVSHM